jgi:cob(I)alamin adenosyltransferase
MKIYTGSGDKGKTSLFSGERVPKYDYRVEALGDVDELNSLLGLLSAIIPAEERDRTGEIEAIQNGLFQIGAWLAATKESPAREMIEEITEERVQFLERAIDRMAGDLPPLKAFIIPGGHLSAGMAHLARTVCRRAERHVVALSKAVRAGKTPVEQRGTIIFLNRLSDYLFTLARYCNWTNGLSDKVWGK